mgnify:CR=1 FL=1
MALNPRVVLAYITNTSWMMVWRDIRSQSYSTLAGLCTCNTDCDMYSVSEICCNIGSYSEIYAALDIHVYNLSLPYYCHVLMYIIIIRGYNCCNLVINQQVYLWESVHQLQPLVDDRFIITVYSVWSSLPLLSEQITRQTIAGFSHIIVIGGILVCFCLAVSAMFCRFLELVNHVHSPRLADVRRAKQSSSWWQVE